MATKSRRKGISVQTYRHSSKLAIRLEYDHGAEQQSVFLNGELKSSFHCPVGFRAKHTFRGEDEISREEDYWGEWSIDFAVEQHTYRIRYELSRRNTGGEDTKWYWWDRNTEPEEWERFPVCDEDTQSEPQCDRCGSDLKCPACTPSICSECGTEKTCLNCLTAICPSCEVPLRCPSCSTSAYRLTSAQSLPAFCQNCNTELECPYCASDS